MFSWACNALAALLISSASYAQLDVVIFVIDEAAKADLALYGGPVPMANLEALAAQGVRFDRCYANAMCQPTRRSLLTGHWWVGDNGPACPGDVGDEFTPVLEEQFLPELLPHASGIVGKWHVGANPYGGPNERAPEAHGFKAWFAGTPQNVGACPGGTNYTDWLRVDSGVGWHTSGPSAIYEPSAVKQSFNDAWQFAPSPKLTIVCPNLAHFPYHVPDPSVLPPGHVGNPGTIRGRYELMLVSWDYLFGKMLAKIDLGTTLVIVVGDNGTPGAVAPNANRAKETTFERGVRVPLVIAGAGVVGGRTSSELVHVVDLYATAIEAGGGTVPVGTPPWTIMGQSLMPILHDEPYDPRAHVIVGCKWGREDGEAALVTHGGLKLRWVDQDGDRTQDVERLYDLTSDPGELVDQSANPAYAGSLMMMRVGLEMSILP